ncbi:MAG: hypothetical protein ACPLX8_02135 [Nanopusillaceae archaeon]
MSEVVRIRLIPKIRIEHVTDYKHEKEYLSIFLKNGSWQINYEFKNR